MAKGVTKQRLLTVAVPQRDVVSVMAVVAAVLEESYCVVGVSEAASLCRVQQRLARALGSDAGDDYRFVGGRVISRHSGAVVKVPLDVRPSPPVGDPSFPSARQFALRVLLKRVEADAAELEREDV